MNDDVAVMMNETERKRDIRRRKIGQIKYNIWFFFFKAKWRFLHLTRLAGTYSRAMCGLGLYRKFPDGRCQWCGVIHK